MPLNINNILPVEIICLIFQLSSFAEILKWNCICKHWKSLISTKPSIWYWVDIFFVIEYVVRKSRIVQDSSTDLNSMLIKLPMLKYIKLLKFNRFCYDSYLHSTHMDQQVVDAMKQFTNLENLIINTSIRSEFCDKCMNLRISILNKTYLNKLCTLNLIFSLIPVHLLLNLNLQNLPNLRQFGCNVYNSGISNIDTNFLNHINTNLDNEINIVWNQGWIDLFKSLKQINVLTVVSKFQPSKDFIQTLADMLNLNHVILSCDLNETNVEMLSQISRKFKLSYTGYKLIFDMNYSQMRAQGRAINNRKETTLISDIISTIYFALNKVIKFTTHIIKGIESKTLETFPATDSGVTTAAYEKEFLILGAFKRFITNPNKTLEFNECKITNIDTLDYFANNFPNQIASIYCEFENKSVEYLENICSILGKFKYIAKIKIANTFVKDCFAEEKRITDMLRKLKTSFKNAVNVSFINATFAVNCCHDEDRLVIDI